MFKSIRLITALILTISVNAFSEEVNYRLTPFVKPSFQQITLNIDPDSPDFSGETTIHIDVTKETDTIEFYQLDLYIKSAQLLTNDTAVPLEVTAHEYNIQKAKSQNAIKPNRYKLHIKFSGKVNSTSDGMYLSKFEDRNYIFTQFEDMHARRAFPSFDEPHFKIPYQMTINAPEHHTVLSNTLVKSHKVNNGWQSVTFNKTKPMPTYLVAYAVGEFDSKEIPNLKVPGKIYTPKGQAHRTSFPAQHTAKILHHLESYFGQPYPYEKLDFVAVPNFTHGAMENVGLVTYRSSLLLLDDNPRTAEQRTPLMVIAHELAHMWYGNLVTMAWWDDLWLNEAFASWMASKVMMDLYPEQQFKMNLVQERAFGADASPTVKPVKKVVRDQTDVMDGLGLNYSKGESVLQLIESLVGEKPFQQAIQTYMKKHAWGNAAADDLWDVLSSAADFDVPAMMKTYLEQPSYPLVAFANNGDISQTRYHLQGATVKEQTWVVPLAITYKKNNKIARKNIFLTEQKTNISELAEADWIFPNENAMGYMRWKTSPEQLKGLLEDISVLNVRERKTLLYNAEALYSAGEMPLTQMMAVLDVLLDDTDPIIGNAVVYTLKKLIYLVDQSNEPLFAKYITRKLTPWFTRLGTQEKQDESGTVSRLRASVYGVLARYSNTEEIQTISLNLANKYLKDTQSVPKNMATQALSNLAMYNKDNWFNKMQTMYIENSDASVRSTLRGAMKFKDKQDIANTLNFALSEHVGPANTISMVRNAVATQDDLSMFYTWLDKHFDTLLKKLPAYHLARMPEYLSMSCHNKNIDLATKFYANRKDKHEGMSRSFDVALNKANQCVSLKSNNQKSFTQYIQTAVK
ncbi:M1 family metallopeptidase [Paraglaciecola sp.]|uniref:M1 family metallopeptidase n=1 Tax=Paraglaciecola sp. TaxID=1920173 RepID=UPI003EF7CBD4